MRTRRSSTLKRNLCSVCGGMIFNKKKHAIYCKECGDRKKREGILRNTEIAIHLRKLEKIKKEFQKQEEEFIKQKSI